MYQTPNDLPRYNPEQDYAWNYDHAPDPISVVEPDMPGSWSFCGLDVPSPLGIPAGPLLNGRWCLYYASLGFDVVTYKTVRSRPHACYPLPNLQPVACRSLAGDEEMVQISDCMTGSWAVSFGMPSKAPEHWRADVEQTRDLLPKKKLLSVSVVGTVDETENLDALADDYARCAGWAKDSGADCVETNFSCPNVCSADGQLYQHAHDAAVVAQRVREAIGDLPYIVKVGHIRSTEAGERLLAALAPHVSALAMTNSVATQVTNADGSLLFEGERRGICGAATRNASLAQTQMLARLVQKNKQNVELIGVGGAGNAQDVAAYLKAGASSVMIATAAMVNPSVAITIRQQWKG